jgi:uncharacterized repeat protein (TIGR01451 family)
MVAQFTGDTCPVDTHTILTYSQSTNPNSPYYDDQTRMFSRKEWVDEAFCESEIAADPNLQVTRISSAPAADLSVTNSDSPDPVPPGERLTYTVTVTNNGPDSATGVSLTDTLARSLRVRSVRPSQGRCVLRRTNVDCSLGDLAQGASATVVIVVRPTRKGTVTSTASVTASQPSDPDTTNNTATATTSVKQ